MIAEETGDHSSQESKMGGVERDVPFSGGLRRAESACAHSLFQLFKSARPSPTLSSPNPERLV